MEGMPGTINTSFYCDKYTHSIIHFKDLLIEGKTNTYSNNNYNNNNKLHI
jgi:hypothetical protein